MVSTDKACHAQQPDMALRWLGQAHRGYLAWHRGRWHKLSLAIPTG